MATIAIGDIHGHLSPLLEVLNQIRPQLVEGDTVVFLGDYIDRGADSRGCIDAILSLREETPAEVVCLRGNHEDWLLRTLNDSTRHSWLLGMEGLSTVRSYSADADRTLRAAMAERGLGLYLGKCSLPYEAFFDALPASHRAFLSALALCIETPDCICSHAGLDPRVTQLQDQSAKALIWGHVTFPEGYRGEMPVVYGHWDDAVLDEQGWPQPRIVGNTIGIDTISHGVLTAIRMPDRTVIQSSRVQS